MTTIILMVSSMPAVVEHCAELAIVSFQTGNLLFQIIRTINTLPPPPPPHLLSASSTTHVDL